jgi:zinc transport system substrate-binding protein
MRPRLAIGVVALLALAACDRAGSTSDGRLAVVANFEPMVEVARAVGGDRVDVTNLTPSGVEPHDLELDPDQVEKLEDAALVIYMGDGFQPAVSDLASRRDGPSIDVFSGVPHTSGDPHFWLDPTLMADAVDTITAALAKASPNDAAAFRANADAYKSQLTALDQDYRTGLQHCARTDVVTSHEAFAYMARRYGLNQVAIAGLSPDAEPDADRLAQLSDLVKQHGDTTIFYEDLVPRDVADSLARETGAKAEVLSPIEGLTKDQVAAHDDYFSVMRNNLTALRTALGCP